MTVGSYQIANRKTYWFFVIDLPAGDDGKRRQHKRRGFPNKSAAEDAEAEAHKAYGEAAIGQDGSVAAEFAAWLSGRLTRSRRPLRSLSGWKDHGDGANAFRVPGPVGRRRTGRRPVNSY